MPLEKALITNTVTGDRIPVQFNPEEYTQNREINYAQSAIPGLSASGRRVSIAVSPAVWAPRAHSDNINTRAEAVTRFSRSVNIADRTLSPQHCSWR